MSFHWYQENVTVPSVQIYTHFLFLRKQKKKKDAMNGINSHQLDTLTIQKIIAETKIIILKDTIY